MEIADDWHVAILLAQRLDDGRHGTRRSLVIHRHAHDLRAARASASVCSTVPFTSAVSVLVIDCTTTGASPPTKTCRCVLYGFSARIGEVIKLYVIAFMGPDAQQEETIRPLAAKALAHALSIAGGAFVKQNPEFLGNSATILSASPDRGYCIPVGIKPTRPEATATTCCGGKVLLQRRFRDEQHRGLGPEQRVIGA